MQYQPSLSHTEPTTRRPITSKNNYPTRTARHQLVMDAPVEEALPRADAHIARYHRLLALVQAERFFEPAGASVEAKEWLAWAHFVRWVLVGMTQSRSLMLLTLLPAFPLRIVLERRCCSPRFAAFAVHVPRRRSHHEPYRSRLQRGKRPSWTRCSLRSSGMGSAVRSRADRARRRSVTIPRPARIRCRTDLPRRLPRIAPYVQRTSYCFRCASRGGSVGVARDFATPSLLAVQY